MSRLYLGVDLGGTNIAAGIVDETGTILCKKSVKTNLPKPESKLEGDIFQLCLALCKDNGYDLKRDIASIGVGTPGAVNGKKGLVYANVNFGYKNWPVKANLEKLTGMKIFVENDANTAIVAEVAAGSARGCKDAIIITLGTGVGGGVFIDGKIFPGHNYSGTEVGHMVIEVDGRLCNCGRKGCFERYASAAALTRDTKVAMENDKASLMWQICPSLDKVNAKTAFDGQRLGDKTAIKVVESYIKYLACGIINIINIFQPQVLCLGGGVSNEGEYLTKPLQKIIDREDFAINADSRTQIKIAKFRNDAGIIGAALLGVNNA